MGINKLKFLVFLFFSSFAWGAPATIYDSYGNPVTATGGALNVNATFTDPAETTTGSNVPGSAIYIGARNGSGKLTGLLLGQQTMANSLACVLPSDQSAIPVSQSGSPWGVNLTQVGGSSVSLGQTTMSASVPVAISSNQSAIPVSQSGTWTIQPGNTANTTPWLATISQGGNSATVSAGGALKVDGSAVTQPVSGTVTANIGITNGLALDATVSALQVSQGSSTSGQKGGLVLGAVTTAAPSYTTAQSSPLSLTTAGNLRVDGSSVTQPVSIAGNQAINLVQVAGSAVSTGHGTAVGSLRVELPTDGTGVLGLNAGSNIIGKVGIDQTTPGTTNGVQVNAALPAGANNIGKVQDLAPLNSTGSGSSAGATVSTVITLTAPANAVGAFLMNMDTSTANIRWAVNRTATTTLGQQLQPGRNEWIPTAHDISLVAESGSQTYDIQWISQ